MKYRSRQAWVPLLLKIWTKKNSNKSPSTLGTHVVLAQHTRQPSGSPTFMAASEGWTAEHCGNSNRHRTVAHVSLRRPFAVWRICIYELNGNPEHVFATRLKLLAETHVSLQGKKVKVLAGDGAKTRKVTWSICFFFPFFSLPFLFQTPNSFLPGEIGRLSRLNR